MFSVNNNNERKLFFWLNYSKINILLTCSIQNVYYAINKSIRIENNYHSSFVCIRCSCENEIIVVTIVEITLKKKIHSFNYYRNKKGNQTSMCKIWFIYWGKMNIFKQNQIHESNSDNI